MDGQHNGVKREDLSAVPVTTGRLTSLYIARWRILNLDVRRDWRLEWLMHSYFRLLKLLMLICS